MAIGTYEVVFVRVDVSLERHAWVRARREPEIMQLDLHVAPTPQLNLQHVNSSSTTPSGGGSGIKGLDKSNSQSHR